MPVDFTRRPHFSGRRNKALRILIGVMLVLSMSYGIWSVYNGHYIGIIFPVINIIFIYLIFPGWFEDFFNKIRIFGTFKKPTPRTWRDELR